MLILELHMVIYKLLIDLYQKVFPPTTKFWNKLDLYNKGKQLQITMG